mgnify:CR=1 FL=1
MTGRLAIEDVRPQLSAGTYPSKAVVGELVPVSAQVWREGHDAISATLTITGPKDSQIAACVFHPGCHGDLDIPG